SKAIFLDRDGTVIEDRGHLKNPEQVLFYPFTFEALKLLQKDFLLFIVTNQSGIAKGLLGKEDVEKVNLHVLDALEENGIKITKVYYCPHNREDECKCIKPKPYFLKKAAEKYGIDLANSYVIGDHPHDVECGLNAGASGIFVLTGHGSKHLDEVKEGWSVAANLLEAAEIIIGRRFK
ncbi:MAG: HAD-IIIA family hydrolase, partial [Lentisphaerae bacterium]|nr:HAD-IIIA family hydrolase [Lentisphaerota bacterium]